MKKINKKILIVDDDDGFRMALEAKFISEGFTIFTAKDGQEALVMAQKEKPDLILLDILMSKMTGIDTAKKIREEKNDTIIIFLTNLSDVENISNAMQASPSDYIVKVESKISEVVDRVKKRLKVD